MVVDRQDGPITEADIAAAQEALSQVPDIGTITDVTAQSEDGQAAAFNVAFPDDPYSNEALDRTDEMRDALASLEPELQGYVGGVSAIHGRLPRRRPARRPADRAAGAARDPPDR